MIKAKTSSLPYNTLFNCASWTLSPPWIYTLLKSIFNLQGIPPHHTSYLLYKFPSSPTDQPLEFASILSLIYPRRHMKPHSQSFHTSISIYQPYLLLDQSTRFYLALISKLARIYTIFIPSRHLASAMDSSRTGVYLIKQTLANLLASINPSAYYCHHRHRRFFRYTSIRSQYSLLSYFKKSTSYLLSSSSLIYLGFLRRVMRVFCLSFFSCPFLIQRRWIYLKCSCFCLL